MIRRNGHSAHPAAPTAHVSPTNTPTVGQPTRKVRKFISAQIAAATAIGWCSVPSFAATTLHDIERCGVSGWSFYGALVSIFGWFGRAANAWPVFVYCWYGWPVYTAIAAVIGIGWLIWLIVRAVNAWLAARRVTSSGRPWWASRS